MRRSFSAAATIGKAEFVEQLGRVTVVSTGPVEVELYHMNEDGGRFEKVEASTFRLPGSGMDDAVFFTCVDPFAPEGRRLFAAGEVAYGAILPAVRRCEDQSHAGMEAIKFVLRIPEEDRAAAFERMKGFGAAWRAKR